MEKVEIKAAKREQTGKGLVKKLRKLNKIPAIVYGAGVNPVPLTLEGLEFNRVLRSHGGGNMLINLKVSGARLGEKTVIIKDIQYHPVTDEIHHVDFQAVSLTEKIRVQVALHETGESPGVVKGGVIDRVHHEIEVECLPTAIPERVEIDVSALDFGHAIHIKDLKFPEGVNSVLPPDEVVFTVKAPKEEKAPEPTPGEAVEPEVIKKGKEEEGEEKEAEAKDAKAQPKDAKAQQQAPKEAKEKEVKGAKDQK
ncbi:MAG: 50S ribosomal protein L25 [Candidatus Omnitrophica bacterium]|nr:50S ribosomal protein L25 [Candidatus Omnitrophota bacterium]